MTQVTPDANLPKLIVEGGLHRSAVAQLPVGEISVGCDGANAVVVSDLPAPTAFKLRWDGRAAIIEAVGSDVGVGGKVLGRGRRRALKRPFSFTSGGVAFRLDGLAAPAPARERSTYRGFAAGVACTVALAATAALVAAPSWPTSMRVAELARVADLARDVTSSIPAAAVKPAPANPVHPGEALLKDFRLQLASGGLDGIAVDAQADGGLVASGRILPAKAEAWRSAVRWFDTAAAGRAVLLDRVEVSSAAASLQVQAVYTGRTPYVIDGEGQKLFIGASLPDGSVIQTIESRRVVVKRGDQLVAVRF